MGGVNGLMPFLFLVFSSLLHICSDKNPYTQIFHYIHSFSTSVFLLCWVIYIKNIWFEKRTRGLLVHTYIYTPLGSITTGYKDFPFFNIFLQLFFRLSYLKRKMQFRILSLFALVAAAAAQQGSGDNAFKIPPGGFAFTAGQPATISWTPSTEGTVTLKLRQGAASALNPGTVIKCKLSSFSPPPSPRSSFPNPLDKLGHESWACSVYNRVYYIQTFQEGSHKISDYAKLISSSFTI